MDLRFWRYECTEQVGQTKTGVGVEKYSGRDGDRVSVRVGFRSRYRPSRSERDWGPGSRLST